MKPEASIQVDKGRLVGENDRLGFVPKQTQQIYTDDGSILIQAEQTWLSRRMDDFTLAHRRPHQL